MAEASSSNSATAHAWGVNAIKFIAERNLTAEFNDWCGGWKCPVRPEQISAVPGLIDSLSALRRALLPVEMQLDQAEMAGEPVSDATVLFSFMGSGASDHVTVGEFRRASAACDAALSTALGEDR